MSSDKLESLPPVAANSPPSTQHSTPSKNPLPGEHYVPTQFQMAAGGPHTLTSDKLHYRNMPGSLNCSGNIAQDSSAAADDNDALSTKYEQYSKSFAALVVIGAFAANLFVVCITAMTPIIGEAIFGRIFRLMLMAAALSVSASFLAGINAVLFSLLATDSPQIRLPHHLRILSDPSISFTACVVSLTTAAYCFILSVIFFLKKYDPYLEVVLLAIVVLSLCFGVFPTAALFFTSFRFLQQLFQ